jgi:mono/diheme cytochrome c family protein
MSRNRRSFHHSLRVASAVFGLILRATSLNGAAPPTSGQTAPAPARTNAGSVESGRALFKTHQCWACHGHTGETGTRLIQDNGTFVARLFSVGGFINFIRAPRPNDPPPKGSVTIMPSYGVNSLSEQQAADLYAYIRTFTPTQPPLKDIPLLNQMLREGGKAR